MPALYSVFKYYLPSIFGGSTANGSRTTKSPAPLSNLSGSHLMSIDRNMDKSKDRDDFVPLVEIQSLKDGGGGLGIAY
jgi:hypothetical protein